MNLTRAHILAALAPLEVERVEVPEWGGVVFVRAMSGAERDAFELATAPPLGTFANLRARLVALCACEEDGTRLFLDADAAQLGTLDARALDRIFQAARRLNALGADDFEQIKKN